MSYKIWSPSTGLSTLAVAVLDEEVEKCRCVEEYCEGDIREGEAAKR